METEKAAEDRAKPHPTLSAWSTLLVVTIISVVAFIDRNVFAVLVEPIRAHLKLSDTELSLAMGPAFTFCTVAFAIPLGWLGDRYSRRLILGLCMVTWTLGMALCATADSFWHLVLGRVVVGMGEAGLSPLTFSILADAIAPRRRAFASAVLSTSNTIGSAIALSMGGILLSTIAVSAAHIGIATTLRPWQLVTLVIAMPGVLAVLLLWLIPEPGRRARDAVATIDTQDFRRFLRANSRRMLLLLVAFGGNLTCLATVMSWTPAYMGRHFGWPPAQYGPALGFISLLSAGVMLGSGAFQDWLSSKRVADPYIRSYFWIILATLPAFAAAYFVDSEYLFLALYPIVQVTLLSAVTFLMPTLQAMTPPQFTGRVLGMYFSTLTLIGSLGPVGAGVLTDKLFHDPARLNHGIAIMLAFGLTLTIVGLRGALASPPRRDVALDEPPAAVLAEATT
jgi:MFS family permease